jgi:hypothetical protein
MKHCLNVARQAPLHDRFNRPEACFLVAETAIDQDADWGSRRAVLFESDGQRMASMNRTLADLQAFTDDN